jgi:prepilin-type processing-associated H-X9-DG protein
VMVYEKLHNHDGDGINALYGDGHVEFNMMEPARQMLMRQGVVVPE